MSDAGGQVWLFDPDYQIIVDTIDLGKLDVDFTVEKDLKGTPNKCDLKIYNLKPDHRKQLTEFQSVNVSISAGYVDAVSQIYLGELRHAWSERIGPDWITHVTSGDGELAHGRARISQAFKKGAVPKDVLTALVTALGVVNGPVKPKTPVSKGNLDQAIALLGGSGVAKFINGTVLYGSASREMTRICRSLDLTWSIQMGKLQILPIATALKGEALVMDSDHGMHDSPSIDSKGVLSFKCSMIRDVFPGRIVIMNALEIKGNYRIESTKHHGVSHGDEWSIEVKARAY